MTGETAEPAVARAPLPCPRCGAQVEADQSWCLECGLAARTRLAPTPNWRLPLVLAGAVGLAAVVALIVAFVTITGDNAPLPTTAAPPATVVDPAATTTIAPTTTVATVPTTPDATPTVPAIPTETAPPVTPVP